MFTINRQSGFTIIEAVIVIVIAGIVASMVAVFITRPIEGYQALSRRAELVDQAELALRRMQRDIRQALPNSIRVSGGGQVIEFLHVRSGGRYRSNAGGGGYSAAACRLNIGSPDNSFAVMGTLGAAPQAGDRMVIANINTLGPTANAYAGDNVNDSDIMLNPADGTCSENYLSFANNFTFPGYLALPQQRFYIIDTPVSYLCDGGLGSLRRYQNYTTNINHANVDTDAELVAAGEPDFANPLIVDGITACNFTYTPGTPSRSGLVSIGMTISLNNENISLQQQFHVSNIP